ncbi:hypothetical protein SeMB42_g04233 [Synchytrium endobioticum]|uniref:Uncharacterized protein n=1 Tax=Synchytrium endobioticum TaxID=286115 RepID=A0A507D0B5_9FUNG|nr:hypothetical protein SeMB42_g04233 [Synchytrium endobioticum]
MRQELSGEWTDIINLVIEDICHEGIQLTTEHLEEPTNDMSLNRLELGYEAALFVLHVLPSSPPVDTYKTTFDRLHRLEYQYKERLKEKLCEALTVTLDTDCMPEMSCYDPFANYIPIAGERERAADKLMELKRLGELVVSSIFRASFLLDPYCWEKRLRDFALLDIGNEEMLYASNYHALAGQKLDIIIDQVSRFLKKTGTPAPSGGWEEGEIQRLRERLGQMEEVRKAYHKRALEYKVHLEQRVKTIEYYRKQWERDIADMGYSVDAVPELLRDMYNGYLNEFATVFMQLPFPENLSSECLELAASVVRGYPQYLKLLSLARDNPEELKKEDINLEYLKRVEIQMKNQDDYGKRVLALYNDCHALASWQLELVILALSPCVEMCMLGSDEAKCDIMRERLRQLEHRRNEYQQECPTHLQNWVLPGDTAVDYGNHQVNPLEHSVGAHRGGHYAVLPDSSRVVDTILRLGGTNYEAVEGLSENI